ncbi:carboxypeptidase-like regulatory domain-containing protein [Christiangramia sabulilitoris]|uniref:Carboxypeptidase-like regulatory domain-containing protein n=2 Tax=Christiangramia sabulilitoris TaxID=2583991 RepID=A0A550HZH9_9FLAO|nr:carboxypeptidase-like regulatory domain-containing protein [Christiangramia sabulilitoris]
MKLHLHDEVFFYPIMNRYTYFFLILLFGFSGLNAQTKVGGVVNDNTGKTVPFANVVFANSTTGTTTNEEGEFYLQADDNFDTLVVSFIGYETLRIPLDSRVNLNMEITLEESASTLEEVVIYRGKTSKKNNPAIDILKKVWANRRSNGIRAFDQYSYKEYEKLEFDINTIDSTLINSRIFNGMEFIFDYADTNKVTGKTYLPMFINESVNKVYGDNILNEEKEVLLGNKNSGFNQNRNLIDFVKDIYDDYDIYKNYIKFFDKSFVSPISTTGIDTYNYILSDSAYVDNKWCYNIVYYPRRENELTFKGDFWVNDTTWAVKNINLETTKDVNINWIKQVYIEQDFKVLSDSVFLITRDFFMADFGLNKKKSSRGVYAKRTMLYDEYEFNNKRPASFYQQPVYNPQSQAYNQSEEFWSANRLEKLNEDEEGIYIMLDSLTKTKAFNRLYNVATIVQSGYVEFDGWDYGPIYSTFGFNDVEGVRTRFGGRTYFGQSDPWRIEAYGAYGFKDQKFKYGISGKVLLDPKSRLIISGGNRRDVEQLGTSLTNSTDVLGRSLASSSLLNIGDTDKLSSINLSVFSVEMEPLKNFTVRFGANYRELSPASPDFSLDYYVNEERTEIASEIHQTEFSTILTWMPGRKVSGYGVERNVVNEEDFPTLFLNYSLGVKDVFDSDFDYKKIQFFYNQPLLIGGVGFSNISLEAGKTFGAVPLGLLSVVPGNQTYFELYNTFPTLDFYEFVTDSYSAIHIGHNFNGRIFSRIPLLRELDLRELIGFRAVYGDISEESKKIDASGLPLTAPDSDPFYEYSVGIGNILKVMRFDVHFRGNYFQNPDARSMAFTIDFGFHF